MAILSKLKKYFSLFLKYAAPIGLFILLPLLVALYLGNNIFTLEKNKHISELSTKIENNLKDIESEITPESFLLKVARGAWVTFKQKGKNPQEFWNYYHKLCSFLQSEPDFYLFDDNGTLVTPREINLKSRFIVTKLWSSIDSTYEEKIKTSNKLKKQLKSLLGNEFKLGVFLERRNRLTPIIVNTKVGYVYWMNFPNNNKKGILIIFWQLPSFDFIFNQILNRYSTKFYNAFIRDSSNKNIEFIKNKKTELVKKDRFYDGIFLQTVLMNNNESYIDPEGLLWKSVKIRNLWLLAALKTNIPQINLYHKSLMYFLILVGFASIFVYLRQMKQHNRYLSIRIKLIGLFLIAVCTPIMGLSFLGYQYITNIRDNLISDFGKRGRDVLLNIDRELGTSGNVFREEFRQMVKDFQNYDNDKNIQKKFAQSLEKSDLACIDRRLASNASIINNLTNEVTFEGMSSVTDPFSKCCIDAILNTNLMDTIDPGLKTAMQSPELGLSILWDRPDHVQDFIFGSMECYLYWCFSETPQYGKEYYLIMRSIDNVLKDHIQKRLEKAKNKPKEKDFYIFVCKEKKGLWFPNRSLAEKLKDISRRVNFMGKPIETEIDINSKHYLLLGLKSGKLRDYSLYALYPYDKIQNKLNIIIKYIVFIVIFFVFIAIAIGYRLSETFLYPVKRLEDGVKAIKGRNSEFRIEKLGNDEFGGLAQSFNRMIGDLKEMELAKYIQESLLPKSLPKLNGYQMSFSNKMASAVGGDYFDTMLLDEENLCIIIGDVSGHGLASALVMAIAKSVLYQGFKESRNLLELFSDLNLVINTYFNKPPCKKMITLFATIINLPTGRSIFLDAGHNYPMKISKDGTITELKMVGIPVGITKKLRNKSVDEFIIEKGETIVFYTDGIVEATGKTEEQYGYQRFKENLSEMANENSDFILKKLFEKYEIWENGTEPDDDVTLAVLKRLPSYDNERNIIC